MGFKSPLKLQTALQRHALIVVVLVMAAVILLQIIAYNETFTQGPRQDWTSYKDALKAIQQHQAQEAETNWQFVQSQCDEGIAQARRPGLSQSIGNTDEQRLNGDVDALETLKQQFEALHARHDRRLQVSFAWTLTFALILAGFLSLLVRRLNGFVVDDLARLRTFYAEAVTAHRPIDPQTLWIQEFREHAEDANRMLAQTRAAEQRLIDHQETLEQTIRERTHALEEQSRQLAEQNLEWERLASRDHLTGLLNRRCFHEQVERQRLLTRRYQSDACLVLFDLDHFKQINDSYGHDIGDWVLKQAASHLGENQRGSDLFGRWGGEEFVLFLPHTGLDAARAFCERLRIQLADTPMLGGLRVTASFGVTACQRDETLEEIIKRADTALYAAKHRGRDRVELA